MSSRDALIDAAKKLLSTQGYEATSPREIQRASEVGQGSFYHHFDSKADLAGTALSSLAADMCSHFDDLSDTAGFARVDAFLSAPRDALAGCKIGRIAMEASIDDDRIREPVATYFTYVRDRLAEALSDLDLTIGPEEVADLAIAAVQGGYVVARATGDPSAQTNATNALLALIRIAGESPRR